MKILQVQDAPTKNIPYHSDVPVIVKYITFLLLEYFVVSTSVQGLMRTVKLPTEESRVHLVAHHPASQKAECSIHGSLSCFLDR